MYKLKIIGFCILGVAFASSAVLASWIATRNALVSDYSIFLPVPDLEVEPYAATEPPTRTYSELCGSVVHANGDGIGNARVHLRANVYDGQAFTYTDSNGRFTFSNVPAGGKYRLTVRANGLLFSTQSVTVDEIGCSGNDVRFVADPF